jgi:hypothetical protein
MFKSGKIFGRIFYLNRTCMSCKHSSSITSRICSTNKSNITSKQVARTSIPRSNPTRLTTGWSKYARSIIGCMRLSRAAAAAGRPRRDPARQCCAESREALLSKVPRQMPEIIRMPPGPGPIAAVMIIAGDSPRHLQVDPGPPGPRAAGAVMI